MSTSLFMDDYSSEDYSDHDDDYYIVSAPTSPQHVRGQVEIQTQSNDLQNLIIDQQVDVSESAYFDVLPELKAQTAEEEEGVCMEQSIYLAVESYFALEAQAEVQVETGVAAVLEAETAVEELAVGLYFDLEAQVETGLPAAFDTETVLEEGDVIESDALETVEADTIVETAAIMIEEFMYEAVESESDLEAEAVIEEHISDVEYEADVDREPETAVEEEDVIGESIYEAEESDYDLNAEAEDMVEEADVESNYDLDAEAEDMVEEAEDVVVEETDDVVEEEEDFVKEEDVMVEEEHDVIHEALESGNNLQAKAEGGAAMEESIYEPLEAEARAESAVSIEMTTFKAHEPFSDFESEESEDLSDEQTNSCEEESDLSEEEWDSDAEESDKDSSDSDRTEDEEDDVVVSYLKSSAPIRNKAWRSLVPAWVKLPVTDTPTLEDSSLLESFLGHGPMLMLQECGNAVMNAIETLMCELSRIRNDLCRILGALFRQRETTKHA